MSEFYNTTHETGKQLDLYQRKASSQDTKVLDYFQDYPDKRFTPSEIHQELFSPQVPLTSVRRAMTNLTNRDSLVKCEDKRQGVYGRPEYCWRLKIWSDFVEEPVS